MVADERRIRADVEEELKELKTEKEALRNALRLVASENTIPNPGPIPTLPSQLGEQDASIQFVPVVGTTSGLRPEAEAMYSLEPWHVRVVLDHHTSTVSSRLENQG